MYLAAFLPQDSVSWQLGRAPQEWLVSVPCGAAGLTSLFVVSWPVGWWLAGPDGFTHTSGSCLGLSANVP